MGETEVGTTGKGEIGLLKATGLVGSAELVSVLVRLALVPARTALLSVSQYGEIALWLSVLALVGGMVSWPVIGLARFLPGAGSASTSVAKNWARVQLAVAGVACVGFGLAAWWTGDWVWGVLAAVLMMELWIAALTNIARGYRQFRVVAIASAVAAVVGGVTGLLLIAPLGPVGVLLGGVVAAVPTTLLVLPTVIAEMRNRVTRPEGSPVSTSKLLWFALPLAVGNLAWAGTAYFDRLMLGWWGTLAELGLYSFAYTSVALPLHMLTSLLMGVAWNQAVAVEAERGLTAAVASIRSARALYLTLAIPISMGLCVFASPIVHLLAPAEYASAAAYVPLIVAGVALFGLIPYTNQSAMLSGSPSVQTVSAVSALVANVALNVVLIPMYGAMGAAVATFLSYGLSYMVSFGLSRRVVAKAVPHSGIDMRALVRPLLCGIPPVALGALVVVNLNLSGVPGRIVPAMVGGAFTLLGAALAVRWWSSDTTSSVGTVGDYA